MAKLLHSRTIFTFPSPSSSRLAICTPDVPRRRLHNHGNLLRESQTARASMRVSPIAAVSMDSAPLAKVEVELGDRSYPIDIGAGLMEKGGLIGKYIQTQRVLVVTNETIAPLYLDRCVASIQASGDFQVDSVILPDGEEFKNLDVVKKVWDKALETRLPRHSTLVALGGGVIGDMTGYAAACYQRGTDFMQIPTTVMAQVDSSVGGKTGVNHPLGKNMIGAFYQPKHVLIDTDTLNTLPDRELASGISEIVKYGLIRDPALFEWLEENVQKLLDRDAAALTYAIERSCINKAEVVAEDEFEGGVRATLNLGHTFGHAMETGQGYGVWLHGEAVSAGIVMAAHMSEKMGWITSDIYTRAKELLVRCNLPVTAPTGMTPDKFRSLMALDKKVLDGALRLVLLRGPLGSCVVTGDFDIEALNATLNDFCNQ